MTQKPLESLESSVDHPTKMKVVEIVIAWEVGGAKNNPQSYETLLQLFSQHFEKACPSDGELWTYRRVAGFYSRYPLVNVYITMENHHAINGSINYFYGHVQ